MRAGERGDESAGGVEIAVVELYVLTLKGEGFGRGEGAGHASDSPV